METTYTDRKIFSLSAVAQSIQKTLQDRYGSAYWIKAEMIKLNHYTHSGHCFPDLVEKQKGKVVAQMKANIWCDDYKAINQNFIDVLGEPLKDGIKILFLARIKYHPEFGLSLTILDIDPQFTLGDLLRERQETLSRLQREGFYELNKSLVLPLLPRRIAIISEQTSKGYADFLKVFAEAQEQYGFRVFHQLFPSLLQGEKAVFTMLNRLREIKAERHRFDLVVIVRGGGADLSLTCYDHYDLAKEVATFPLPVITGIGHATNLTITEMVAHKNAITPTNIAHFILDHFHSFHEGVEKARQAVILFTQKLLQNETQRVDSIQKEFLAGTRHALLVNDHVLKEKAALLKTSVQNVLIDKNRAVERRIALLQIGGHNLIDREQKLLERSSFALRKDAESIMREAKQETLLRTKQIHQLSKTYLKENTALIANFEKNVRMLDPENVLKRGYSITLFDGKAILSSAGLKPGDTITTVFKEGQIDSTIK